jgi:histidyl-tRNA synthetase
VSDQEKAAKRAQWEEINRAKAAAKQKDQSTAEKAEPRAGVTHKQFQAIRGTRDLLPPDTELWNRVEQTAHEVFTTYGYGEIRPPIIEPTELFARAVGGDTDIVSKEMYTFEDRPPELLRDRMDIFGPDYGEAFLAAYEKGELPQTASNAVLRREISDKLSELATAREKGQQGTSSWLDQDSIKTYNDLLLRLSYLLSRVALGDFISLRPEATASVCRAYIEHNMQQLPQPVKLYYMGPMFRRERPQKGRYRQFYQIGAEILGGPDAPAIDAELIEMLMTFFDKCGLAGTELSINSIGHAADNCRRGYVAKLREELLKVKDKLGADSQRRIETNPLRVLDSKLEHEQAVIATLPHIADHLCDECKTHYAAVKRDLDLRGVAYRENWRLVRGLDYYMRTTFEITAQGLGSQNAVCGGGRYDGLVELLGGPPTKGIGFAIGEDRLILSLQDAKPQSPVTSHQSPSVYIAWMGQNAYATAIRAAKTLRNVGFRVELPATELKFGKALERANKLGSRFALILGEDEVGSGMWTVKNLADGTQTKMYDSAVVEFLKRG